MPDEEFINYDGDAWVCICLNTAHGSGFAPIDQTIHVVEPTETDWKTDQYVCMDCGRVMDGKTLRVVRRIDPSAITSL
jgi:hypothetical protein